jgi:hypothetical protein
MSGELKLYRAAIRAMPDNPARHFCGDKSGLHRVLIYKRRGAFIADEDFVETAGSNLPWYEAFELCGKLNRQFAGESLEVWPAKGDLDNEN